MPDPTGMTRAERLHAAADAWGEWASTATTDDPPDELVRQFALPDEHFGRCQPRQHPAEPGQPTE